MKKENELSLIIAYYISRYDRAGIRNLGYATFVGAYRDIGKRLGIKASSISNMRDEFDPIHDNNRVGWYQRPMSPSRCRIVEMFSSISEPTLRDIVRDVIKGEQSVSNTLSELLEKATLFPDGKKRKQILRGPTGRKAEQLFENSFHKGLTPFAGEFIDCRDLGEGYDFRINMDDGEVFIEVKGLDGYTGGVVFTDKEWRIAGTKGDRYYLVVVAGISDKPKFYYVQNPVLKCLPRRNISTSINISWNIPQNQIMETK
ncbi:MAG: DUF3883 domain-containing protein [Candidatus Omnitrophica bacterium]|nr:DUF3883 domain-containing protein [Candidatus Omnitrophota bacterium]